MSADILKDIASEEEKAAWIEAQAAQKAKDIVASAKRQAAETAAMSVEQAEKKAEDIVKSYEDKAAMDIENIKLQIRGQCEEIRRRSGEKLNEAVDFIVERIVNQQ